MAKRSNLRLYMSDMLNMKLGMMADSYGLSKTEVIKGAIGHMWGMYEHAIKKDKEDEDFAEHCHDSDPTFSGVEEGSYRAACGDVEDSDEREVRRRDAAAVAEGASMLEGQEGGKDA